MTEIEQKVKRLKKLPPANTLVELAMAVRDDGKVTSQNINRLRQACNDIADLIAETYYKDSFSAILRKFKNMSLSDNNFNRLLSALVKESGRGKDLKVNSRRGGDTLLVEVKSLKVRERSARTGADRKLKSVLAGFFDEPREFGVEQVKEMSRVYEAVYLPPTTLKKISDQSKKAKNPKGGPLLRSNKLFAKEIKKFVLSGKIL